ncbi:hypothetical protein [Azovibrio restrictus]|uniref:hypothetical protein n=1 Tax=Azovibrio restrictus TaxID=146938 RepID=UPI0026EC5D16|nr:hypothetical protein [Azovibrio restrictus]MDD3482747.1 hypothetical protein [Azovibrio restrictus]
MKRDPDQRFVGKIRNEVNTLLDRCSLLNKELEKIRKERQHAFGLFDAVGKVKQLEGVVNQILRPATLECLRKLTAGREFDRYWDCARGVLAWLCVLAVKPEWVDEVEKSGGECLEFQIETGLGLQILSARFQQTRVTLPSQRNGATDFPGEHVFGAPITGSSYNVLAEVDKLLLDIWRRVFPDDSRAKLSAKDEQTLDAVLEVRRVNKTHNHFLPFSPDQGTPLNDRQFVDLLLKKLPHLVIIRLKTPTGVCPLLAASEADLLATIISFLDIPSELSQTP